MNVALLVCPVAWCTWSWRYDADDHHSTARARDEERQHWTEYHDASVIGAGAPNGEA